MAGKRIAGKSEECLRNSWGNISCRWMPISPNSPHTYIHMFILASSRDKRCSSDWLHTERCAKDASKTADAPTPPMVPAAHKSFTGTNLQGDCGDAADASTTAPRKEHVGDANDKKSEPCHHPKGSNWQVVVRRM